MREKLARLVATLSAVLVILAALAFGYLQNPKDPEAGAALDPERVAAGADVYEAQGCALCHSIAGEGNPEHPLDQIGARLSPAQMQRYIAPPPDMAPHFDPTVFEMKQPYHELPEEDMTQLTTYLQSLR